MKRSAQDLNSIPTGKDNSVSLSVEETNELRKKLGLAPLTENTDNHVLIQPSSKITPNEIRQRIETSKLKRARQQLLSEGQSILKDIQNDEQLNNSLDWINTLQQKTKTLQSPESSDAEEALNASDEDISDLKVSHEIKSIDLKPGESISLTLKDSSILNDLGELKENEVDYLENIDITAKEKRHKLYCENKYGYYNPQTHRQSGINLLDETDEENSQLNPLEQKNSHSEYQHILPHYDYWGEKKKSEPLNSFTLNELKNKADTESKEISNTITLVSTVGIQRDFYSNEEYKKLLDSQFKMPKFKKKKKLSNLKKTHHIEDTESCLGFLNKLKTSKDVHLNNELETQDEPDDLFLYEQLSKRKIKPPNELQSNSKSVENSVADLVSVVEYFEDNTKVTPTMTGYQSVGMVDIKQDDSTTTNDPNLELSGATEFCRTVKTSFEKLEDIEMNRLIPLPRGSTKRGVEMQKLKKTNDNESSEVLNESNDALSDESEGDDITEEEKRVVQNILNEDLLDGGLISALTYLKTKGELIDDRVIRRGRRGVEHQPLHMPTVPGEIRLEYRDDYGKIMTPKEAFRYISWVFHGKGPGKRKREKILRQMELKKKMKIIGSKQEELPTMIALQKQQKKEQPYLILSSLNPTSSSTQI